MSSPFDEFSVPDEAPTPLHDAAAAGDLATLRRLLDEGSDANLVDWRGLCLLFSAVEGGSLECVRVLLEYGSLPDGVDYTLSPLVLAAWNGRQDILELLVAFGADVNRPDPDSGDTAVMGAAATGNLDMLNWLVDRGASPAISTRKSETALRYAQEHGHDAVVRRLTELLQIQPDAEP